MVCIGGERGVFVWGECGMMEMLKCVCVIVDFFDCWLVFFICGIVFLGVLVDEVDVVYVRVLMCS